MGKANSKEKINWVEDLEKAVLIAKFTNKPVFLMILKSMCPTCKTLAPQYSKSKEIQSLSKYFVMVRFVYWFYLFIYLFIFVFRHFLFIHLKNVLLTDKMHRSTSCWTILRPRRSLRTEDFVLGFHRKNHGTIS